jgi:hypothetical protein
MASSNQPWIQSATFDLSLILGPSILACLIVLLFNGQLEAHHSVGPLAWLALVVCLDVAHVYSSLFRTYFDSSMEGKSLLWVIPLLCWGLGAILYSIGPGIFWTCLAYVAVFHFVRQQYGFAMIYGRGERSLPPLFKQIDRVTIYSATLYPLIFWHTHLPRNFNWFIEGDFIGVASPTFSLLAGWLYLLVLIAYISKEIWIGVRYRTFNIPRNLIVATTAVSWYIGIVWLNNDLAFTLTNVVSHGLPYVALIWLYGHKNEASSKIRLLGRTLFSLRMVPVYVAVLIALAYVEEGFWDGFVWRDHSQFFPIFSDLPVIQDRLWLALLVPILALPQSTHYIFDAFLWRVSGKDSRWKDVLLNPRRQES